MKIKIMSPEIDEDYGGIMAGGVFPGNGGYWICNIQLTPKAKSRYDHLGWHFQCGEYCNDSDCEYTITGADKDGYDLTEEVKQQVVEAVLSWGREHQEALKVLDK